MYVALIFVEIIHETFPMNARTKYNLPHVLSELFPRWQHTIFGKITGNTIFNLLKCNDLETDEDDRLAMAMSRDCSGFGLSMCSAGPCIRRASRAPRCCGVLLRTLSSETRPSSRRNRSQRIYQRIHLIVGPPSFRPADNILS